MKRIHILVIILIQLQFIISSCSEDFLDVSPKATQIESNYYKNADEAFNGLVAAYDPMGWEGAGGTYATFACLVAASDEAYGGGGSSSDVWYLQVMNNYSLLDPANGPQMGYWTKGFAGVYRSNVILTKLEEGVPGLEENVKDRYMAEAKLLRAYYYFDLVRLFRNVPLITRNMSTEKLYDIAQAAPEEVYIQIEQDLKDAIAAANLPNTIPAALEGGRMTKGIAHALLGKVYLYQEKWSEAAQEFEKVNGTPGGTSSFGYRLLGDFEEIFRPDNTYHSEAILEITHTSSAASRWGNTTRVEGLVASTMFGPRSYDGPEYYSGWGGCPIIPEFYDVLRGDPRFKATVNDVDSLVDEGVASYVPGYLNTGYFVQKYAPLTDYENAGAGPRTLNYPQNYIEMRLADTYLMEAEALVQAGGDLTRAAALLNAVRARVGLNPVAATLENIYDERRIELATEGHRWYDLVRTGRAASVLAFKGFTANKNEILPIPLEELSNTKLEQNPNY